MNLVQAAVERKFDIVGNLLREGHDPSIKMNIRYKWSGSTDKKNLYETLLNIDPSWYKGDIDLLVDLLVDHPKRSNEILLLIITKMRSEKRQLELIDRLDFNKISDSTKIRALEKSLDRNYGQIYLDVVKKILKKGPISRDSIEKIRYIDNPLYNSVKTQEPEIVKLLLKAGFTPNSKILNEAVGMNSRYIEYKTDDIKYKIIKLLLGMKWKNLSIESEQDNVCILCVPAYEGDYKTVKLLLEYNFDPNEYNSGEDADNQLYNDSSALMHASEEGHLDIVELLLKEGADPNYQSDPYVSDIDEDGIYFEKGSTALIKACKNGHVDVVKMLLNHSADIEDSWELCHEHDNCQDRSIEEVCPTIFDLMGELAQDSGLHTTHWLSRRDSLDRPYPELAREVASYIYPKVNKPLKRRFSRKIG